jgi:hypothetical protein
MILDLKIVLGGYNKWLIIKKSITSLSNCTHKIVHKLDEDSWSWIVIWAIDLDLKN